MTVLEIPAKNQIIILKKSRHDTAIQPLRSNFLPSREMAPTSLKQKTQNHQDMPSINNSESITKTNITHHIKKQKLFKNPTDTIPPQNSIEAPKLLFSRFKTRLDIETKQIHLPTYHPSSILKKTNTIPPSKC